MRVYELAKELGITSKEALLILERGGFSMSSHMAILSNDAITALKKSVGTKASSKGPDSTIKKNTVEKPAEIKKTVAPPELEEDKLISKTQSKPTTTPSFIKKESEQAHSVKQAIFQAPKDQDVDEELKRTQKQLPQAEIVIDGPMPLYVAADRMGRGAGELILMLMKKGMLCNRNFVLSVDAIVNLAQELNIRPVVKVPEKATEVYTANAALDLVKRWPVVVVMGHVDHGKTTLLDYIRKANVAGREKGGITQHLGAYEVNATHGKIVFLDTPGHEAFSHIRKHGTKVTDLVVLVVAADDGIMPQTVEAIECAKSANVPVIVAINKVDKISSPAAIERIKRQLSERGLMPEDWGGQVVCVPISAKTGQGVNELLEMIILQTQMMELRADEASSVKAYILETRMEKGHGPVATAILRRGLLKQGDFFKCGDSTGKVRLLINSVGEKIAQVGPSIPVVIVGFDKLPSAGDWLETVSQSEYLAQRLNKSERISSQAGFTATSEQEGHEVIQLIVKTDTDGSLQALIGAINGIKKRIKDVPASYKIMQASIGDVSEGDVDLASDTGARIVCLHVSVERKAASLAKDLDVVIIEHNIIYRLVEELEEILLKKKEPVITLTKTGEAVVRKIFNIKNQGIIAGSYVTSGSFNRAGKVVCLRRGKQIGQGSITSLQKDKKPIKEVSAGLEFAFMSSGFQEWEVDDVVQCFIEKKEKN